MRSSRRTQQADVNPEQRSLYSSSSIHYGNIHSFGTSSSSNYFRYLKSPIVSMITLHKKTYSDLNGLGGKLWVGGICSAQSHTCCSAAQRHQVQLAQGAFCPVTLLLHFCRAMNNYHISLADSWHQEAQVIYETWQVILIKCGACGCKVAGREQILSSQRVAKRHALLQTRWAGLSGLPQLSCKPGPCSPGGQTGFSWRGRRHTASPLLFHNNKHMTHKQGYLMQSKSHVDHERLSHNYVLTRYKHSCLFPEPTWSQHESISWGLNRKLNRYFYKGINKYQKQSYYNWPSGSFYPA